MRLQTLVSVSLQVVSESNLLVGLEYRFQVRGAPPNAGGPREALGACWGDGPHAGVLEYRLAGWPKPGKCAGPQAWPDHLRLVLPNRWSTHHHGVTRRF